MTIVGNPKFLEWHIDGLRNCGYSDVANRLERLCKTASKVNVDSVEHFARFISSTAYKIEALDIPAIQISLTTNGFVQAYVKRDDTGNETDLCESDSLRCLKDATLEFIPNGDIQFGLSFGKKWHVMGLVPEDRISYYTNEFTRRRSR